MQIKDMQFRECCFKDTRENSRKAVWEITHACVFNCEYCFQAKKRRIENLQIMHPNNITRAIDNLSELKVTDVIITGGEIFNVQDSLDSITSVLKKKNIAFSFSTNVVNHEQFINFLISLQPKAINLSLDPSLEHDQRLVRNIDVIKSILKKCDDEHLRVKITSVVTSKNIIAAQQCFNILSELAEEFNSLTSVYFTNPYDIGLTEDDVRPSHNTLQTWIQKTSLPEGLKNKIKFINFHRFNTTLQRCPAGDKIIHIEPNGNIYPCHLFANLSKDVYRLGNILSDPTAFIDERLNSFAKHGIAAIEEYKESNERCKKCRAKNKCFGGCIAEIISLGNLIEPQLTCKHISPKKIEKFSPKRQYSLPYKNSKLADLTSEEIEAIESQIKINIRNRHDLAHGFDHVEMVVKYARHIAHNEGANLRIVTPAAYFHDYEPRQKLIFQAHTELSAQKAIKILSKLKCFSEYELNEIYKCIDTSSYGSSKLGYEPMTIEAKCVRDADWLDAIGARGIARVFAFGASHGCSELGEVKWDLDPPPQMPMSLLGPDPSPIYHFFSKLLWVKDRMTTVTGKQLAEVRHRRLLSFLKDYKDEMVIFEDVQSQSQFQQIVV